MDNKTYSDLMSEYEKHKDSARRFGSWDSLDKFMNQLAQHISPRKVEKMSHQMVSYSFDDMGTPLPHDEPTILATVQGIDDL